MKATRSILAVVLGAIVAGGCAVGPNYSRPAAPQADRWKEGPASAPTDPLPADWWRIFADPQLEVLESRALEANQDLQRAAARVTEARALTRAARAELYPTVGTGSSYSRSRTSENAGSPPGTKLESDRFRGSFDLSYELDVWGRVRRSVEAARADSAAVAMDLEVVRLTLTADVARNYFSLRSLDHESALIGATVTLRRDAVRLQETRSQAGLINEVDVTRARAELANVEAELHAVQRARAQTEHALAVLCGQPPAEFSVPAVGTAVEMPTIPAALPSTLLQRRPDLVEAEQSLRAASARIAVAKAAFFPTIQLTSLAGLESIDLGTFLSGASRMWSVGPSVHVPVFEGGRNRANLQATQARYEQATAAYRSAILNAFREVEDALSDLATLARQGEAVNRALVASLDTVALARERYQKGLSSYLEVVDAERVVLQSQREETQLRGQRAVATILLAKAVGGGWNASTNQAGQAWK